MKILDPPNNPDYEPVYPWSKKQWESQQKMMQMHNIHEQIFPNLGQHIRRVKRLPPNQPIPNEYRSLRLDIPDNKLSKEI